MKENLKKINSKLNLQLAKSAHEHVLLFQRRMRRARFDYEFPASNDTMLLLMLLSSEETITATEISKILVIPKAKVSRQLIALEENGYIKTKGSKLDRRSKELNYTEKGKALFKELLRINNEISMRGILPIEGKDRDIFERFFRGLNDGLNFPNVIASDGELPLWVQQRRIASASGMVGTEYMNSGIDLADYQIFFELSRQEKPVKFSEIDKLLPFHISKISRALKQMEKKAYIKKITHTDDARGVMCELTNKGKDFFQKIDNIVANKYLIALVKVDVKDIHSFIKLMDSLEGIPIPPPKEKEIEYLVCKTKSDFEDARAFLVENLVKNNRHRNMSQELIPEDHPCLRYVSGGVIIGLLVLSRKKEVIYYEMEAKIQDSLKKDVRNKGLKILKG